MTGRLIRPALGLMLSLVVAACAQGQSNPTGPGASTGPSGGASGSFAPAASPAADLGAAEMSLRQDDRTRAGLVNLGPGALDLAALMDQSGSLLLQKGLDALKTGASGSTFQAAPAVFADVPAPAMTIVGPWAITTQTFDSIMPIGVTNTRTLDDNPFPDAFINDRSGSKTVTQHGCPTGDCEGPQTENVTVAGNPGIVFTQMTLTAGYAGSAISVDVTITTYGEVHDATSHATIYRIEGTGTGHIDGDACPDASGIAKLHIEFTAKENYFIAADPAGGTAGYGLNQSYSADVRVRADDNANLAGIDIAAKAHADSKGGVRAAGADQSDLHAYSLDAAGSQTFGYDPASGFTGGGLGVDTASSVDALKRLAGGMALYTELPAKTAAKATETAWRSGMCIRVSASPNGGDVGKDSVTSVTVTVKQRYEGTELNKPVEAVSFSGVKSIDPAAGQKQPAPATFRYTAGSAQGDKGAVTFKSVSNRGIGQTSVQFVVGGPTTLRGSADMKTDFKNGPFRWTSQSHASDVVWQLDPNLRRMRPAFSDPADKISMFTIVSGQLAWSYQGIVQGSLTDTCPVRDSGTATLGANSDQQHAYLFIDWTKQPATYSFQGAVDGLGGAKCMDSAPQPMDSVWAWSDPNKDPTVSGTDAAFVLEGTYHSEGSGFGTISTTYSWSFSSEP